MPGVATRRCGGEVGVCGMVVWDLGPLPRQGRPFFGCCLSNSALATPQTAQAGESGAEATKWKQGLLWVKETGGGVALDARQEGSAEVEGRHETGLGAGSEAGRQRAGWQRGTQGVQWGDWRGGGECWDGETGWAARG